MTVITNIETLNRSLKREFNNKDNRFYYYPLHEDDILYIETENVTFIFPPFTCEEMKGYAWRVITIKSGIIEISVEQNICFNDETGKTEWFFPYDRVHGIIEEVEMSL